MAPIVVIPRSLDSLIRMALALLLAIGAPHAMPMPGDPARALAQAAGALCQGGAPDGLPQDGLPQDGHRHDTCQVCQGGAPAFVVPRAPVAGTGAMAVAAEPAVPVAVVCTARRAAYASRAPPGPVG